MVRFERSQPRAERFVSSVQGGKDRVRDAVVAQRVPDVFCRVDLWAAGRQQDQSHVLRHRQLMGGVPARLVHDHDDEFFGVALCHGAQEQRHGVGVVNSD